jgi:hypothetical protein
VSLPYENATSGDRAVGEMRKILMNFGANKFGVMEDTENKTIMVQFEYRGRPVSVTASVRGYAAAWLKEHPYNASRMRRSLKQHEQKALEQAGISVYSILRDWIKGQITAIETQMLTFEGAFLGQILLASGKTVLEHIESDKLLPSPAE